MGYNAGSVPHGAWNDSHVPESAPDAESHPDHTARYPVCPVFSFPAQPLHKYLYFSKTGMAVFYQWSEVTITGALHVQNRNPEIPHPVFPVRNNCRFPLPASPVHVSVLHKQHLYAVSAVSPAQRLPTAVPDRSYLSCYHEYLWIPASDHTKNRHVP